MNGLFRALLIGLVTGPSTLALAAAGGISGGGGGLVNPVPTTQAAIIATVQTKARPALTAWFHAQQDEFKALSTTDQRASPFNKVFAGTTTILDVLASTGVELMTTESCTDRDQQHKDGSVVARDAGYVCLSPFSMAPRLDEENVDAETLALLAHEFSHVLGTDENEAVAIQVKALTAFAHSDIDDFVTQPLSVADEIKSVRLEIEYYITHPAEMSRLELTHLSDSFAYFMPAFRFNTFKFAMLNTSARMTFIANLVRLNLAGMAICTWDPAEKPQASQECQWDFDHAFTTPTITAKDFLIRGLHNVSADADEFLQIQFTRPTTMAMATQQLQALDTYISTLEDTLKALAGTMLKTKTL